MPSGLWIVRSGMIELSAGSGRRKVVVQMLYPGSVDGDTQLIFKMALPYSGPRSRPPVVCSWRPRRSSACSVITRPWPGGGSPAWPPASHAASPVCSGFSVRSLQEQTARLLLEEENTGRVHLPQRTLTAMLRVQRPSLNKVLRDFQRRGLIEAGYGLVTISDRARLEALAPTT